MDKKTKKDMKKFTLDEKIDYVIYLQELIARTDKLVVKLDKYLKELYENIEENRKENYGKHSKEVFLSYKVYDRYLCLLSSVGSYVLNVIGDGQKSSLSYFKFRNIIKKRMKKSTLDFEIRSLTDQERTALDLMNRSRNWSNHVPESLLTSQIELIHQGKLRGHSINPIQVGYYESVTLNYVEDLYQEYEELYKGVRMLHQSMKKDYSSIIGESVVIVRKKISKPMDVNSLELAKLSADINN